MPLSLEAINLRKFTPSAALGRRMPHNDLAARPWPSTDLVCMYMANSYSHADICAGSPRRPDFGCMGLIDKGWQSGLPYLGTYWALHITRATWLSSQLLLLETALFHSLSTGLTCVFCQWHALFIVTSGDKMAYVLRRDIRPDLVSVQTVCQQIYTVWPDNRKCFSISITFKLQ